MRTARSPGAGTLLMGRMSWGEACPWLGRSWSVKAIASAAWQQRGWKAAKPSVASRGVPLVGAGVGICSAAASQEGPQPHPCCPATARGVQLRLEEEALGLFPSSCTLSLGNLPPIGARQPGPFAPRLCRAPYAPTALPHLPSRVNTVWLLTGKMLPSISGVRRFKQWAAASGANNFITVIEKVKPSSVSGPLFLTAK